MKSETDNLKDILIQRELEIRLLKEKLDKYEAAASGATEGLWDWDFETNIAFVSKPWKAMLGINNDTPLDMTTF